MATTSDPAPGLRERKKDATRRALRAAGARLFAERGFTGTTIGDIAAEAEVSERTFFRYFDSKEDLLLPDGRELYARIEESFLARPADEHPLDAACAALLDAAAHFAGGSLTALTHPLGEVRDLARAALVRQFQEFEERLGDLVLDRLPADEPDRDLRAVLIANCALSAARAVLRTLRARREAGVEPEPGVLLPRAFEMLGTLAGEGR
ncbi:TetR/AcrR family transcriptional regulator (plasmid) [Streptomyces sp. BI20]|uniref:TetR/AcrR family transcriptional regulator n=1 Tax=Streptomyces sp. BI20 TaxID=3403460 RepID=UPI003C74272B